MDAIPEADESVSSPPSPVSAPAPATSTTAAYGVLDTLTSGQRLPLRGGGLQAHVCAVGSPADVESVLQAFARADAFKGVTSWSYAYRLGLAAASAPALSAAAPQCLEVAEDGLDEGCGEKILAVLRRFELHGLLLVVCRWQEYGSTPGLELIGTSLYSLVTERCKDLVVQLQRAIGLAGGPPGEQQRHAASLQPAQAPARASPRQRRRTPLNFDFNFLPPLPEPRAPTKFGPNHFLAGSSMKASSSLPNLFNGGDPRQWMENDKNLRELPEAEIWELRALRQPDERIERVLQAVAAIRGQRVVRTGSAAARWGHCQQALKSNTFRTELLLLDASGVPREAARTAMQLLAGLDAAELRRASHAAAALFEWASSIARWRLEGPPTDTAESFNDFELQALQPREAALAKSWSGPSRIRAAPGRCLRRRIERQNSVPMALTR
eukprot:TRINITY_DN28327_c0_g1_i1.p1 TRINITY_DN28327_c0_g1~~TRINITY_DN28327_c0_g1_i1.p1  ORF type:complete len:439 (+),score=111.83 TRINITY_DN28327_c0_g1_i1:95-1411(+)